MEVMVEKVWNPSQEKPATQSLSALKTVRVAVYARVSTDQEIQQSSLAEQMKAFKAKIAEHPGWVLVDVYADEGISGTSVKKRKAFLRMMEDCEAGKVDYVMTKSISRFARNTVECLSYVRRLQSIGVQVFFEKEGIDTGTAVSEMLLTVLAAFAQEESRSISENLKWGIRKRFAKGVGRWTPTYGFRQDESGNVVIEPDEAEIVRMIFKMYQYGINVPDILDELNFLDAPSARGKKWTKTSLVYLLQNEKYIGDQRLQKWVSVDHISHKSVPNDSTAIPSYYVKNTHTPIIDRHTFRQVQRIMELKDPHGEYSRYPYCDTDFICPKRIERRVSTAKKRVAAYCRVSTQRNEQEESFETQKAYYEELICRNPDWELVKIYSDKHSATSVKNRPGFQEMMADAKARKIDILLVKSISRFARNVVDCQQYLQKLESYGVCVQFEKENIRTDDPTSGFVLSLLSAVAQDESHSISKNVQLSYESRFKRGEYNLGNNRILGYDCIDGELVPNQDAWIVKEVFCRFLEGQTYRGIREGLAAKGARTLHGKTRFSVETIRYMLGNESYVGDKCLQKLPPRDYLTKKPDPNREHRSNYLKDDHEAIIDRETWEKAQAVLKQREECSKMGVYKRSKEHHFLYGTVFCGECGAPFVRRTYRGKQDHYKAWNCKERQKGARGNGCRNRIIREDELMQTVLDRLGWDEMDEKRFKNEVSRILVYQDRIEIE